MGNEGQGRKICELIDCGGCRYVVSPFYKIICMLSNPYISLASGFYAGSSIPFARFADSVIYIDYMLNIGWNEGENG